MIDIIFIAFFSLIGLLILHEFSHFIVAKRFGIPVKEFGIGYPPKIIGKKIGETIYSLNLIPFGAFIRISEQDLKKQPIWQRALVIMAGIVSFWVFCAIILIVVLKMGTPIQVSDWEGDIENPIVQIVSIVSGSPAESANLKLGDMMIKLQSEGSKVESDKVKDIQDFIQQHKGKEVILTIKRGEDIFEVIVVPRISPPQNEGSLGVALVRTGIRKYSFVQAIMQGVEQTIRLTLLSISGLYQGLKNAFLSKPSGLELVGPIGIMRIFVESSSLGFSYFLRTMAMISLNLAIFNALPIPVSDGGKIFLLGLEKIRKRPLNEKIEQNINNVFFVLLLGLIVFITIKDVIHLFY